MIDWDKELSEIIKDSVFADVKPIQHRMPSSDRLVKSFEEILLFVEENNRMPSSIGNITEKMLYRRLTGIKTDKTKYDKCKPYDRLNLLDKDIEGNDLYRESQITYNEISDDNKNVDELLSEILNDPIFNISPEAESIFDLPEYMKKDIERANAEYIGKRTQCEDFDKYEYLFKNVQADLKDGKRTLIKFKESHLQEGNFFVVGGVLTYLEKIHNLQMTKHYKKDGRIRCIYENGTESNILLRSLGKSLFIDGYTVTDNVNYDGYLEKKFTITDKDIANGYIYVLKSKSNDSDIVKYKNLYNKISEAL